MYSIHVCIHDVIEMEQTREPVVVQAAADKFRPSGTSTSLIHLDHPENIPNASRIHIVYIQNTNQNSKIYKNKIYSALGMAARFLFLIRICNNDIA